MDEYKKHYSVLKKESLDYLTHSGELDSGIFAAMTFGAGGHTCSLAQMNPKYQVYSVDQDPDALKNGENKISKLSLNSQVKLHAMNFESFPAYIEKNEKEIKFDGILLDLGVSSHHFDNGERGFSFRFEAELDMRMDKGNFGTQTAAELLNSLDEEEIADIFWTYGEERFSRKIAANIVEKRKEKPIVTTKDLEDIIFHTYPKKMRFGKTHPATRCFQALRIVVNRELEVLENIIPNAVSLLKSGGRLVIISFHSLEDRIVKHRFKFLAKEEKIVKILTKKPITPGEEELGENNRSRSAKLRVVVKL